MIKDFFYYNDLVKEVKCTREFLDGRRLVRFYNTCEGPILGVGEFGSQKENKTLILGYLSQEKLLNENSRITKIEIDKKTNFVFHNLHGPCVMTCLEYKHEQFYIDGLRVERNKFYKDNLKRKISEL